MAVKRTGFVVGAVAGAGVAAAALAGVGLQWPAADAQPAVQGQMIKASTAPMFAPPVGAPLSFADIVDKVSPAVVSIDVTTEVEQRTIRGIPGLEGFPFGLLPQRPGQGQGQDGDEGNTSPRTQRALSSGSGFFISKDGYVVTNNHVVENAKEIKVTLLDKRELIARVVGRDEATDLAVLKVEGRDFPFVSFENSAKPRVGDWVIAVGNPFGLGNSATAGIISAYGRDLQDSSSTFFDYVQIDAPINRGNSGGPTFDIYGRVIGVNTAIFSPSGGSVGIGFAIPADTADSITKQLISGGRVTRGYLGVTIGTLTTDQAEALGRPGLKGALIRDVVPGGPGAAGGLRQGDVVTAVDGQAVGTNSELTRRVALARAGQTLNLAVLRDGRQITVAVRSGTRPNERQLNASNDNQDEGDSVNPPGGPQTAPAPTALGLTLQPLDEARRRQFGIDTSVRGVVITAVAADSDAAEKTIRRGDVIVRADSREVAAPADVTATVDALKRQGRKSILLWIRRGSQTVPVPVQIAP